MSVPIGQLFTYAMSIAKGLFTASVWSVAGGVNNSASVSATFGGNWANETYAYWKFGNYCQDNNLKNVSACQVAVASFTTVLPNATSLG